MERLKETGHVYAAISEEMPKKRVLCPSGFYIVTFNPSGCSSVVDANMSVGTIFTIWRVSPNVLK